MMKIKIQLLILLLLVFPLQSIATTGVKDKVEQYFISSDEPTTKDALWTADNVFKVAVYDDGSSRDGYAEYVCQTLSSDFDIHGTLVRVVDVVKVNQGKWVNLGTVFCD